MKFGQSKGFYRGPRNKVVMFRLEIEPLARTVFFELLDEYILDDLVTSPPPQLISEYITYLGQFFKQIFITLRYSVSEGQLSQLQAAVVHLPIECLDLHQVEI